MRKNNRGSLAALRAARKKKQNVMPAHLGKLAQTLHVKQHELIAIKAEIEKNIIDFHHAQINTECSIKISGHTVHFVKPPKEDLIIIFEHKDQKMIGQGAVKDVYESYRIDCDPPQEYATIRVKSKNKEKIKELLKEIRLVNQIDNPYVSNLIAGNHFTEKDGTTHYTLFAPRGSGDLFDLLTDEQTPISFSDTFMICYGIVSGLHDIHQANIIHQDIKPENVLVKKNKFGHYPAICDFGNAVEEKDIKDSIVAGNPAYLAPETLTPELMTYVDSLDSEKKAEYLEQLNIARTLKKQWKDDDQLVLSDEPHKKNDVWSIALMLLNVVNIAYSHSTQEQKEILCALSDIFTKIVESPRSQRRNIQNILSLFKDVREYIVHNKITGYLEIEDQINFLKKTRAPVSQTNSVSSASSAISPNPASSSSLSSYQSGLLTGGTAQKTSQESGAAVMRAQ